MFIVVRVVPHHKGEWEMDRQSGCDNMGAQPIIIEITLGMRPFRHQETHVIHMAGQRHKDAGTLREYAVIPLCQDLSVHGKTKDPNGSVVYDNGNCDLNGVNGNIAGFSP